MPCFVTYKGVKYSEAEFLAFLANGEYERIIESGDFVPPTPEPKSEREQRIEAEEDLNKKLRKHYLTIRDNITVEQSYKDLLKEDDYAYQELPNEELLKIAQAYIDEHGVEKSIKNVIDGAVADGRVGVGVAYLLFKNLHTAARASLKNGDNAVADVLFEQMEGITNSLAKKGTTVGQQTQAFSLFSRLLHTDPVTTEYYYRKKAAQTNQKAKSKDVNKENSGEKAKTITKKVKKYAKEWAEQVEKDLGGKPQKSKLSDRIKPTKEDNENINNGRKKFGGAFNDATRIATLMADPEFRKYTKSVLKVMAYDTVKFAEEMIETLGKGAKKHLTELYNIAQEELSKELSVKRAEGAVERKIKERQKEIGKKLLKKVKDQSNPDSLWGKYKQSAINSLIQTGEKRLAEAAKEIPAVQDFINKLAKNAKGFIKEAEQKNFPSQSDPATVLVYIVQNEEKYTDLLTETIVELQERYKDNPEKLLELDAYFGQLFNTPFSPQTLEAVVKGQLNVLGKSIAQIAKSYYSEIQQTGEDVKETLQERLMTKFGLDEETAGEIAQQVEKRYKEMVSDRIAKDLKSDINRQLQQDKQDGVKSKPVDMLDRLVSAAMLGKLDGNTIMDIFRYKYGVTTFTQQDSDFIFNQVERIANAKDQWRKAEETAKIINYMAAKSPIYFADVMQNAWYASVLSSALLPIGTGEVNVGFNMLQVASSGLELLPSLMMQSVRQSGDPSFKLKNVLSTWLKSVALGVSQTKRATSPFAQLFSKNFLNESGTNFLATLMYGSDSFVNFERPLEQVVATETDFRRLAQKAKDGDTKSQKILKDTVSAFFAAANTTKYVGRMLAAQDMFFQGIIKNMWLYPIAREKFYNEGLRGEELNKAIENALFNTEIELENAQKEALDDVVDFDFEIKESNGKFDVYHLGKLKKTFNTNAEAKSFVAEEAPKGIRYKRAVMEKLNKKEGSEIIQRAGKVAQNYVATNVPTGGTGWLYKGVLRTKGIVDEAAKSLSASGRASESKLKKLGYGATAYVVKNINLILPFVKVPINLAKMTSDYTPLGAARAYRGGDLVKVYQDELRTQTEKDIIYSRAMVGASIFLATVLPMLMDWVDDDDDRDKKNDKETLDLYEELTGKKAKATDPIFTLPKEGDICGSLDYLSPSEKKFLESSGLAKAYCRYDGKTWVTVLNNPRWFSVIPVGTARYYYRYVINNPFNDLTPEERKAGWMRGATAIAFSYGDAMLDISSMKGLAGVSWKRKPEERLIGFAENLIAPFKQTMNPAALRNIARYWDGQARNYINPFEDPKGYAETYIPIYGSFAAIKNADIKHGMLGENLHQLPSEQQGVWTPLVAKIRFWEANKPQRDMYAFLQLNGYVKFRYFPVKEYFAPDGKKHIITKKEQEELQQKSGNLVLSRLQATETELQNLANSSNEKFVKLVDDIISKSQMDVYEQFLKSKGFEMEKRDEVDINKEMDEAEEEFKIKEKAGFYDN